MKIEKINLKIIIFILIIIFDFYYVLNKYETYKNFEKEEIIVNENLQLLNEKIEELGKNKKKKDEENEKKYEKLIESINNLELYTVKDESEFKKMIYIFSRESKLQLKNVSNSEIIWEKNGYMLKYVHFILDGSLNDFGKFLYLINKSNKYVDSSKSYIQLNGENFKISLGFIEKIEK